MLPKTPYIRPSGLSDALKALEKHGPGARVIAGGTDLIPSMRARTQIPSCLVDIQGLGLDVITRTDTSFRVGATCTFNKLARDSTIRELFPALQEAAQAIGAVQTKNLATIGGNLSSAVPSCDSAPALYVLKARLTLVSLRQQRVVPVAEFFQGPRRTVLAPAEVLAWIDIPLPPHRSGAAFFKIGRRKALTLAIVNAAASVCLAEDGGSVRDAAISLGAVAPTPIRAQKAESVLAGQAWSEELVREACEVASGEASPISDIRGSAGYRRELCKVLVRRALMHARERALRSGQT
ncbi:MAG: xanthine dehydrogenase family protein subunit M [Bacillota bacterium]